MSEKILVPVLGESITEATVAKWLKNPGDTVKADEPIVELETDKVNLEVPSPITGVLTEINSQDGSVVEVGALLGSVSEEGGLVKTNSVKKEKIKIDAQGEQKFMDLMPSKETDVTLRSKNKTIVIDTKYYKEPLKEHYGKFKPKSDNINQVSDYLKIIKTCLN